MRGQSQNPISALLVSAFFVWAAYKTQHWHHPNDQLIHWLLVGLAGFCCLNTVIILISTLCKLIYRWLIMRTGDRAGSAGWASSKELKKEGLYKRKKDKVLAGMDGKKPVWVQTESSGLVLSPAGGHKTIAFVIPALCHDPTSMLVPDIKGTLACITGELRRKKLGHKTLFVNPAGMYENIIGSSARYNPLQILIDDWENPNLRSQLISDAQAMAAQLHTDPPTQGENQFFRNGARKFLVFSFLYLIILGGYPTLSHALSLLSDVRRLKHALNEATATDYLDGDFARLAQEILNKFEESGDTKQIESFREGAAQSIEVFSPSGDLAESTSHCDFRFHDMRKEKMTIYLMADPTRTKVYAPWIGLLSWCAMTELIRYQNQTPVTLLLEEVCNFKIEDLPSNMTLLREFKVRIWLIVQELEEWARVYGRESLETLLSQTEVKIIISTRSFKTCQLISNMLGQSTIKTKSYNLGRSVFDDVTASMQDSGRPLMTPDEVRRCKDILLIVRDMKPKRLSKIGYHEIKPWSRWCKINPLFGKVFKGKTRLRL